jgi:predicted metal-dependent peptidase
MTADQKMSKAKVGLLMKHPFFASLLMRMEFAEDNNVPAMYTTGEKIGWNREFIDRLTLEEVKGVLVHEAQHVLCLHPFREGTREHMVANMAMDYAINPLIKRDFTLPKGCLDDYRFSNMEFEAIYKLLEGKGEGDGDKEGDGSGDGGWNVGEVREPKGKDGSVLSPGEIKQLESETKVAIQQAYQQAKSIGKLPGNIERYIKEILNPIVNWKEALHEFATTLARNDYTWTKPNRRFIHAGLYLPTLENPELGDLVIVIDTSGSISVRDLSEINAEVIEIARCFSVTITVIYCDSEVNEVEVFQPGEEVVLKMKGGGGTNFNPAFARVEKEGITPIGLLYFTDGYVYDFPKHAPDYRVLWVLTEKNEGFPIEWGEQVILRTNR